MMVKMSPFVVSVSFLAILSVVNADISHLTGYQYPSQANHHGTASLKLHSVESPASTQYFATYGNGKSKLPNSYVPPASGSPFESSVPLPKTYTPQPPSQVSQPPTAAPFQQQRSLFNYQTQPSVSPYNFQQYQQQQQYQQPASVYQPIRSNYNQPSTTYNQVRTSQEPIVTKHFYVHAAPEDPEDDIGPRFIPVGPPRKTYKIIFIKTPTYGLRSQIIPIPPQTEEKTIVYVLSKKPTFDQNVQLPQPTTTEPTKPEVFFVKYKTQEEADRAQKEIQDAYNQVNEDGSQPGAIDIRGPFSNYAPGSSTAFGGQESAQQYQQGGQYTSTVNHRNRRFTA